MAATLSRSGFAGLYALIFGATYVLVAFLEVVVGRDGGLTLGDGGGINSIILLNSGPHNAIHWIVGIALVGAALAGLAKPVVRTIGVVFVVVTLVGLVLPSTTMDLLGYGENLSVPIVYTLVHALTAVTALYAGFVARD
ncbi:MAG: hypothetical protein Q8O56_15935 [Solirubrobacteraceae bacterium]|nr:hypothetical protein [Solirubrobacteraceae bacterium]